MGANSSSSEYQEIVEDCVIQEANLNPSQENKTSSEGIGKTELRPSSRDPKMNPEIKKKMPARTPRTKAAQLALPGQNEPRQEVKVQKEVTDQLKKLRKNCANRSVHGGVLETVNDVFFRDLENLELKDIVGHGAWGNVRKAEFKKSGAENEIQLCAVKEFTSRKFKKEDFPGHWEISITMKLNHKNIVKYISHTCSQIGEDLFKAYLIMEYVEMGSLQNFLKTKKSTGLSDKFVINLCRQITSALFYIHNTHRIVHRDVKPGNILMEKVENAPKDDNSDFVFKLCDFGCARRFESQKGGPVTPAYAAPEFMWGQFHQSGACDIYSLGMTMLQCSSGENPKVIKDVESLQKLVNQQARQLEGIRSDQLRHIAKQCIWMDPAERITTKALLTAVSKLSI